MGSASLTVSVTSLHQIEALAGVKVAPALTGPGIMAIVEWQQCRLMRSMKSLFIDRG
jgi:hypothetical protein